MIHASAMHNEIDKSNDSKVKSKSVCGIFTTGHLTMKFFYVVFISIFLVSSSFAQLPSFLQKDSWNAIWNSDDEESPLDPGWMEQYYRMKKNADGIIPRLPYQEIYEHESASALREQLLFNVEELGPGNIGGRTRAILIDADDEAHVISGGVSGGLWVTNDSGLHWKPVNDFLSSLSITSITQDHFNHDLIYVGTGEALGNSAGIPGNGVYRSTDHGLSFIHLPSTDAVAFDYIHRIVASPIDTDLVYVATHAGGLFRSYSQGDSMIKIFATSLPVNDLELTQQGDVWITVNGLGIFHSSTGDSGSFVMMTSGLPAPEGFARIEIAAAPSDPSIIYAALEEPGGAYYSGIVGIFKSTDGGLSWNEVGNPDDDFGFYMSFPWYSMCMAVKPDDPDFIVFAVGDFCYSTDGGMIWKKNNYIHVDHHAIVFNLKHPTRFYEGNDGGIHRFRTDQMHTHTDLNNGYGTVQYYAGSFFPTGLSAYAGAQDNGTHFCKNGDENFTLIFGGDGAYCAIHQQFPIVGYVSYQNGMIYRTDDATSEYPFFYSSVNNLDADADESIDEGAWFINPFEINLVNSDQLFFVTLERVWQTIDGGYSWLPLMDEIFVGPAPYAVGMSKEFSPTIYIGGEKAIFIRVDDTYNAAPGDEVGLTVSVPVSVTEDFIASIAVHPDDKSTCYVAFSNYSNQPRLWKVSDATSSSPVWTSISGDLPMGLPVNYIEADPLKPDSFLLAGTDFGLYLTNDGGQHWFKDQSIPNVVVQQVKVRSSDRRVFIFTHGRGMWTATLDSVLVGIEDQSPSQLQISAYPNPFADLLFVKSNETGAKVLIKDVNGRTVCEEELKSSEAAINTEELPNGIYFLSVETNDKYLSRKIMKLK